MISGNYCSCISNVYGTENSVLGAGCSYKLQLEPVILELKTLVILTYLPSLCFSLEKIVLVENPQPTDRHTNG